MKYVTLGLDWTLSQAYDDGMTNTHTRMNYAVGHNMPGYLPEADIAVFSEWDDAKAYLIAEMLWTADIVDDEDEAEKLTNDAVDLNLANGPEWGTTINNTAWWIMLTDDEPDED